MTRACWISGVNDTDLYGFRFFGIRRVRFTDGKNAWLFYWGRKQFILWS
jgi:hypothetical protein